MKFHCETTRLRYPTTTPLLVIRPEAIRVLSAPTNVITFYQKRMSKADWAPASGRKLGFLVVQDDMLLGLIFLASPVIVPVTARDNYLFPNAPKDFKRGPALRSYMDMSVCVAAQPIGWHWNLGKLMAMIAPTLGDYVTARRPVDTFKGVVTTSLFGGNKATQYTRIYKYLGETKGNGHEQHKAEYPRMKSWLRERHPGRMPSCRFRDGATNSKMQVIAMYYKLSGDKKPEEGLFFHGHKRGIYYHPAVPPEQRSAVIQNWYERWGLPRYEKTQNLQPPYQDGRTDRKQIAD